MLTILIVRSLAVERCSLQKILQVSDALAVLRRGDANLVLEKYVVKLALGENGE